MARSSLRHKWLHTYRANALFHSNATIIYEYIDENVEDIRKMERS